MILKPLLPVGIGNSSFHHRSRRALLEFLWTCCSVRTNKEIQWSSGCINRGASIFLEWARRVVIRQGFIAKIRIQVEDGRCGAERHIENAGRKICEKQERWRESCCSSKFIFLARSGTDLTDLYPLGYYSQFPPVSKICHSFDSKHNHITFLCWSFSTRRKRAICYKIELLPTCPLSVCLPDHVPD